MAVQTWPFHKTGMFRDARNVGRYTGSNLEFFDDMSPKILKRLARLLPGLNAVMAERDWLRSQYYALGHPPGHFYSPIPSLKEVEERFNHLDVSLDRNIPGIDLNRGEQEQWLLRLATFYPEQPFSAKKAEGHRYYFENEFFEWSDALFLYGFLRATKPKRIVEVGSGFSSAVMLDTNERFLGSQVQFTFIDPEPERLLQLISDSDSHNVEIVDKRVQEISTRPWESLTSGDILFIDSSHVSKCGSDVNFLFSEVVPNVADGVLIHVHDIGYPFEYPKSWFIERKAGWNEAYLLQAFLQFNSRYKIIAWVPYINLTMADDVTRLMPLCRRHFGGSLWMRKSSEPGPG